jgi:hypothetical protein
VTGKDYPDWGGYPVSGQSYPLKDLAEAVVRLGSPVIYDRSGAVAFMESFEFGLGRCYPYVLAGGSLPNLTADTFCSQGHACQLNPGVGGAGDFSAIESYIISPALSLWGLSIRFATDSPIGKLYLHLKHAVGTLEWNYALMFDLDPYKLYVRNSAGAYVEVFSDPGFLANDQLFHFLKVVVDPDNTDYVRAILDGHLIDLSAYEPQSVVWPVGDYLTLVVSAESAGVGQLPVYIDDIIMTYNESD